MHPKPEPRLLAVTAHDLRGAVGVLDGAVKELSRELPRDNNDVAKLNSMVARSTQRLLLLGDRLSTLALLMEGRELDIGEALDLTALVKEAAQRTFAAHARRGLRLRFEGVPLSLAVNAPSMACAASELTALFCGFTQAELVVRVTFDSEAVRVIFESDNASEGVQRALRDASGATQANAGLTLAECVVARHRGQLLRSDNSASNATICLVVPR